MINLWAEAVERIRLEKAAKTDPELRSEIQQQKLRLLQDAVAVYWEAQEEHRQDVDTKNTALESIVNAGYRLDQAVKACVDCRIPMEEIAQIPGLPEEFRRDLLSPLW